MSWGRRCPYGLGAAVPLLSISRGVWLMNLDRLTKLLPRLASDHDGEVVATVAAIRRTLDADGADLHALADLLGNAVRQDELEAELRAQINLSVTATAQVLALRERVAALESALARVEKAPPAPRPRRQSMRPDAVAAARRERDEIGEKLRGATMEVARLRAVIADLMARPRGTLPPSWDRSSPIERAATLEAWAEDPAMKASERRWARRLLLSVESGACVDPRDARKFTSIVRRG